MGGPIGDWPVQQVILEQSRESWSWLKWVAGIGATIIAGIVIELVRRRK